MHFDVEVLIEDVVFPFCDDLCLLVAPIFGEEVVKCLHGPILGNDIVTPLDESQLHPLLPEPVEMPPHPINSDLLGQAGLLIIHVVFKAPGEFLRSLYARREEPWNLFVLIDEYDWIAGKFEPALQGILCDPPIAGKEDTTEFRYCPKLIDIASCDEEKVFNYESLVFTEHLLQGLFKLSGGQQFDVHSVH